MKWFCYQGVIKSQNPILVHNCLLWSYVLCTDIVMNQTNWIYFVLSKRWQNILLKKVFDSLLLLLMLTKNKQMWPTSLISWYVDRSSYFLLNLRSLWMVLMMNILLMTSSFDGFQSEGPLNIEPIMVWWLTVKPHQGLHWLVCNILGQIRTSCTCEMPKWFSQLTSTLTTIMKLYCLSIWIQHPWHH